MTDERDDWITYARQRVHGWRHTPDRRPKEIRAMDALLAAISKAREEALEEAAALAAGWYMKSGRDADVPACREISAAIRSRLQEKG